MTIVSHPATDEYREGWESIFGKKKQEEKDIEQDEKEVIKDETNEKNSDPE
jgi:hypothetical protein